MPAVSQPIRVEGLKQLQDAFRVADNSLSKALPAGLRRAAEPVRIDAEVLAVSGIRHIGLRWSRFRVGVRPGVVYVAPKQRSATRGTSRRRRPNLAGLLMNKAMSPALQANKALVEQTVSEVLDEVGRDWANA